ncbi:hypothetical protein Fmac_008545 [Flemingia macrophylla]|uniref:Uncharacterized protein n=1 Tax=Flemingia macrophylla TaxID=520843 RepID=A0ABD1MXP5_9FABA
MGNDVLVTVEAYHKMNSVNQLLLRGKRIGRAILGQKSTEVNSTPGEESMESS